MDMETPNSRLRRKRNINSPASSASSKLLIENDDLEEKRMRRRSKLLSNNILSPGGVQSSPGRSVNSDKDKRKSVNLSHVGMSNVQIKEHYANCIKLSSENKINAKNAFGLHLIDYMKDLLKQSQRDESGTNFQIASCTLDAGVKIYAYRVDSVHSEAYKVLGSLGRAKDHNEDGNADQDHDNGQDDDNSQPNKPKKQRKRCTGKTIETNLKNINCEQYDLDFEVDPFFHKISATFDEGGTAGLLSYQLRSRSDLSDWMMNSDLKVNDVVTQTPNETSKDSYDMKVFKDLYQRHPLESKYICPQFQSFLFRGWDKDTQEVCGNVHVPDDSFDDNVHRFDVNAPVIQEAMDTFEEGNGFDGGDDDNDKTLGPMQFDAREASLANLTSAGTMNTSLKSSHLAISLQPSEYSYFSTEMLSAWAGPLHWKIKPLSKEKNLSTVTASSRSSNNKKANVRIDFAPLVDTKKHFSTGRGATHLKESTLERYAAQMTILPPDLHYEAESLFKLYTRVFVSLKRQADAKAIDKEDDEDWYDYNNKNDREGFCPIINDDDGGYDDDDDDAIGCSPPEMSMLTSQQQPTIIDGDEFKGDNLVAPPNKVRILDINYAKAAKRIDVKKLKSTMWRLLCDDTGQEKENNKLPKPMVDETEENTKEKKDSVSGAFTFKTLYDALPSQVSNNMAKNLSGPIAFVCLLYLANEKELKLSGTDNMDDIVIEQGI